MGSPSLGHGPPLEHVTFGSILLSLLAELLGYQLKLLDLKFSAIGVRGD
jgi:hypothetical protein